MILDLTDFPGYDYPLGAHLELKSQFFDVDNIQHTLNKNILTSNVRDVYTALSTIFPYDNVDETSNPNPFSPAEMYLFCVDLIASGYFDLATQEKEFSKIIVMISNHFQEYESLIVNDNRLLAELYFSNMIALFFHFYRKIAINSQEKNIQALALEILGNIEKIREKMELLDLAIDDNYVLVDKFVIEVEEYTKLAIGNWKKKNPSLVIPPGRNCNC